jgi:integrase
MKGSIRAHGAGWQIKYDLPPQDGRRITRYKTVRGSKKDAQRELRRLLSAVDDGSHVEPSRVTVAEYCRSRIAQWQASGSISALTHEGYARLCADYIGPHLGAVALQKLTVTDVEGWHNRLRSRIGARSISAAHRLLSHSLKDAVRHGLLVRNVAALESAPRIDQAEVAVIPKERIGELVDNLRGRDLYAVAITALFTGARRNELLALTWADVDLAAGMVRITKALEETRANGITIKPPKSAAGKRDVSLPAIVLEALRDHRREQLERRMALGAGKPTDNALVFGDPVTGRHRSPRNFSKAWARCATAIGFSGITFHALRHSHASMLIRTGLDIVTISKRLGHAKADVTLRCYAHLVEGNDRVAADAIDQALAGLGNR